MDKNEKMIRTWLTQLRVCVAVCVGVFGRDRWCLGGCLGKKQWSLEASATTLRNSRLVLLGNKTIDRYSAKPKSPPHQPSLELQPPEGHLYLLSQQRNASSMPATSYFGPVPGGSQQGLNCAPLSYRISVPSMPHLQLWKVPRHWKLGTTSC